MRTIEKGCEPPSLTQFKRKHPNATYQSIEPEIRQSIRAACIKEQYELCAYCCQRIDLAKSHNEHLKAQAKAPNESLNFNNIVASCTRTNQCGRAHGHSHLPLTPLMPQCESEIIYEFATGLAKGTTERAKCSIKTLNLGHTNDSNRKLVQARRQIISDAILEVSNDGEITLEDRELLELLIEDYATPKGGRLEPLAPIICNALRHYLDTM